MRCKHRDTHTSAHTLDPCLLPQVLLRMVAFCCQREIIIIAICRGLNIDDDDDDKNRSIPRVWWVTFLAKSFIQGIKGHTVHSITDDPMKNICVMCKDLYHVETVTFEQRLVADEHFCPRCWSDIMNTTYDNDLQNDFSKIRMPI